MAAMTGGCACGRVRYSAEIEDDEAYLCHCRMCQRASGNVSLALKTLKAAAVRWEREPDYYASSPIARRGYCRECGASLTFQYLEGTDKMDLTVASFDDPSRFKPAHHFGAESMHRAWIATGSLPETRSDEYEPLNQRWSEAGGKRPG
jgi:hypothetical protein